MQALTRALGCTAVSLNRRNIDLVRARARALSVPRHLLSTANLVSSLLDEIEEQDRPALLVMDDDLTWLLGSQATSEVLLEELKNPASRAFFVMLSPETYAREQLKVVYVVSEGITTYLSPSHHLGVIDLHLSDLFSFLLLVVTRSGGHVCCCVAIPAAAAHRKRPADTGQPHAATTSR